MFKRRIAFYQSVREAVGLPELSDADLAHISMEAFSRYTALRKTMHSAMVRIIKERFGL